MSVLKDFLAGSGPTKLFEANDARIGKFFSNKKRGLVVYPFAKTAKGYKILFSDAAWKGGKPSQKSVHIMDFQDKFYVPDDDPDKSQVKKIKEHPKYLGEATENTDSTFKFSDRLRAVAGQDRLPKLGESDTVEVDDFVRELAGVQHSRPGLTEAKLTKTEIRALKHLSTTISRHVDNIPGKITVFEKLEKKGYAKVAKWPLVLATAEGKKQLAGTE
jgi:hypothetical protein